MAMHVPRLSSTDRQGKPYTRRADVEQQILQMLGRPTDEWEALARSRADDRLRSETIVFLVRSLRLTDRHLMGKLIEILNQRTVRAAAGCCLGFDKVTTEQIIEIVQGQILEQVLAVESTRQSEFLEISFRQAVKRRALNQVEKQSLIAGYPTFSSGSEDEDEANPERAEDQLPDEGPGPEELILNIDDLRVRQALIRKAQSAVRDPRHFQAVLLHHGYGWPLTSPSPAIPCLERHFGMSSRQIRNWITVGLSEIRAAVGEKHD